MYSFNFKYYIKTYNFSSRLLKSKMMQLFIKSFVESFLLLIKIFDYIPEFFISKDEKQDRIQKRGVFVR